MKPFRNWLILLTLLSLDYSLASKNLCVYTKRNIKEMHISFIDEYDKESYTAPEGEILPDNKTIRCSKDTDFCYALWHEEPDNKSQIMLLAQGCWENSGVNDCNQMDCVANKKPSKALNNTKFCCCSSDFCNNNVSDGYIPPSDEPEIVHPAIPYVEKVDIKKETLIIAITTVCTIVIILFVAFVGYRFGSGIRKPCPDSLHLMEAPLPPPSTPIHDLTNLKLQEVIGRGRYGSVWRASLNDKDVAVKIFQVQHKQYYLNEKDIYTLPHFEHSSLLKYFGSDERINAEGRTEYLIVLSYAPLGCLQDYLRSHIIDWPTLCKMSQSIAKGLAHLHIDVRKGDRVKPCISHRDMNSRNVLVKADLSCYICDMGFAMKIAGSKYFNQSGEEQHAETTSLSDVGTLRYMAPEVLEGAVNLRDCESSLKQIDVYALGLILWEIMTRCEDLYQGLEVPEYRMPFEAEIGLHPTFEQMQVLISRNKARPLFSEVWKDSNQAVRLLKETVEDCWDQDAEARLTSLCVEERLQELPALWERHKASIGVTGISPTVNPASSQMPLMRNSQLTAVSNTVSSVNSINTAPANGLPLVNDTINYCINVSDNETNALTTAQLRNSYHQNRESSTSEATVETTVTMSPSEPTNPLPPDSTANKNANAQQVARLASVPLQPYQGRNPCIERNMIMEPLEEISVSGNTLLEKGSKFKNSSSSPSNRDLDVDNIFDVLQLTDNVESNALVSNDVLNHSTRSCNPIPYVQNAVHGSLPTRPKQPNVPGNGQYYDKKAKKGTFANRFEKKKGNSNEHGSKKSKDWGFRSFLERKKSSKNNPASESILSGVSRNIDITPNYNPTHSEIKSNLIMRPDRSEKPIPVEACLQQNVNNTQVTTRPTNGPYKSIENGYIANGNCRTAEVGVAHLSPTKLQNGQAPVIKCRSSNLSGSTQSNGLSNCLSESDLLTPKSDVKLKRPTTLPLKSQSFKNSCKTNDVNTFQVRHCRTSKEGNNFEKIALLKNNTTDDPDIDDKKLKIVKRVKTPFRMKSGRFSLYDDRMMSDSSQNCLKMSSDSSLQHARECVSMPIDIDTAITFKNETECSQICTDKDTVRITTHPPKGIGIKANMNGTGLLNGTLPNHWMTPNGPSRKADSGSESSRQISCL